MPVKEAVGWCCIFNCGESDIDTPTYNKVTSKNIFIKATFSYSRGQPLPEKGNVTCFLLARFYCNRVSHVQDASVFRQKEMPLGRGFLA